jgi:hypothetical protein
VIEEDRLRYGWQLLASSFGIIYVSIVCMVSKLYREK